jgi:hypothetical protein
MTAALSVAVSRYTENAALLRSGELSGLRGSLRLAEQFDRQVADIGKLQATLAAGDLYFNTEQLPPVELGEGIAISGGDACDTCGRSNVQIARTIRGETVCIYCEATRRKCSQEVQS